MYAEIFGYEIDLDDSYLADPEPEIRRQLREYESGDREVFELAVAVPDTFFGAIWRTICTIGYGETRTYNEVAAEVGTAAIAVGNASAKNPLPVVVPCHRLVGTNSLRGYRYPGLKEILLRHENEDGLEQLDFELDGSI